MSGKLKRMWPTAAASLVALSSVAQAANGTNGDMSRARQRPNGMGAGNGQHVAQVINPPARPTVKDGVDLFIQGEFLWWRARQDDNHYAASCGFCPAVTDCYVGEINPILNTYGMSIRSPDYEMDAGFAVGIGYNMAYDGWDVFLNWTRFHTSASDDTGCCLPCCPPVECCPTNCGVCDLCCGGCAIEVCTIDPCCDNPCDVPCCTQDMIIRGFPCRDTFDQYLQVCEGCVNWDLDLDLLDLELGREFYVSRKLTLRPHFGLRQAWIDQSQCITYSSCLNYPMAACYEDVSYVGNMFETVSQRNRFRALGPRGGLDSRWMIGEGVSILGEVALSILYGHYTVKSNCCTCLTGEIVDDSGYAIPGCDTRPINLKDSFFTSKAVTDLALGLEWAGTFAEDRWGLALALLWDHHMFFNQNQMIGLEESFVSDFGSALPQGLGLTNATISSRRSGDLSTQGLTVRARLDF